jgi:hypothetical protein
VAVSFIDLKHIFIDELHITFFSVLLVKETGENHQLAASH